MNSSKKNRGTVLFWLALVGALTLPFFGGRELVRGHDRGAVGTLFKTVMVSLLLIVIGFALACIILSFFAMQDKDQTRATAFVLMVSTASTASLALLGLIWGGFQRRRRLRTVATARANNEFLETHGFEETGGDDVTHFDPTGQALRLLEAHKDRLVFMAVGRRGKRAYIDLDRNGRMNNYSGVV